MNSYTHALQDSVRATRASITPVSCIWIDYRGDTHVETQPLMIEAHGPDGSYVRGFTQVTLGEVR